MKFPMLAIGRVTVYTGPPIRSRFLASSSALLSDLAYSLMSLQNVVLVGQ